MKLERLSEGGYVELETITEVQLLRKYLAASVLLIFNNWLINNYTLKYESIISYWSESKENIPV